VAFLSVSGSTLAVPAKFDSLLAARETAPEDLGGMVLMMPSSVDKTGASSTATIETNGSVTFGSCETLSLNGVFTTDYDNYMIVIRHKGSTSNAYNSRLRASGTDASGSNYTFQFLQANGTTVSGNRSTSQTSGRLSSHAADPAGLTLYVYGPFLAQPTAYRTVTMESEATVRILDFAGTHSLSTSYDGITLFADAGNTTGLVSVYGLVGT
jgi:hypothetical protein